MEQLTRTVIRLRWLVLVFWAIVLIAGGYASGRLSGLLSNTFTVPGTDSERVRSVLEERFGDRSDGTFTVVFRVPDSSNATLLVRLQQRVDQASRVVPTGRGTALRPGGSNVIYGDVLSKLQLAKAKKYTDPLLRAVGHPQGTSATYVTGAAAIQHDLDPIFSQDLRKGEFFIAIPIALAILLAVFGLSWAVFIPFLFAGATIMGTLGLVYAYANYVVTATYVTNLVQLIGLGIAIDYSLLIVYRFREETSRPWPASADAGQSPASPPPDPAGGREQRPRRLSVPGRTVLRASGSPPLPAASQEREVAREGGRRCDCPDDADGRKGGRLLGRRGGDRPQPARLHASAVHALDGYRRVADPARVDRGGRHTPARLALCFRPARYEAGARLAASCSAQRR